MAERKFSKWNQHYESTEEEDESSRFSEYAETGFQFKSIEDIKKTAKNYSPEEDSFNSEYSDNSSIPFSLWKLDKKKDMSPKKERDSKIFVKEPDKKEKDSKMYVKEPAKKERDSKTYSKEPAKKEKDYSEVDAQCSSWKLDTGKELGTRKVDVSPKREEDAAYLPWNDYFMSICLLTAARSKDPNTKVGACIVDKDNRIVSVGYNGMPRGIKDDKLPWGKTAEHKYDTKYPYVCHAEMNAIMNGRKADLETCCLYVTKFPCPECAKLIIQSGINHVIYAEKGPEPMEVLVPSQTMFTYSGVICKKFIPSVKSLTLTVRDGQGNVSLKK